MPICITCHRNVCIPCVRAPASPSHVPIVVASDDVLSGAPYVRRLAIATAGLGMGRRRIPDWAADAIYFYDGPICWPDGRPFVVSETLIDDAFGEDGSCRWLSDFVKFATNEPRQRTQRRVLERLRVLDLAFKIDKPYIARHFGR